MAVPTTQHSPFLLLSLTTVLILSLLLLLFPAADAQSTPTPIGPPAPINITQILEDGRQYSMFIRFLNQTQVDKQINSQINNSNQGMTVFAPTDNAFNNLPSGTLNNLSDQQHVQLILYHVLPRYYTLESLQTVSNPVRTLASGQDGRVFGLNFTGQANQVNVSTGIVETPVYNSNLRRDFPLAVYQVDRVLLPKEFYEALPPSSPPPSKSPSNDTKNGDGGDAPAPASTNPGNGVGKTTMGLGMVSGLWLLCMGII